MYSVHTHLEADDFDACFAGNSHGSTEFFGAYKNVMLIIKSPVYIQDWRCLYHAGTDEVICKIEAISYID